MPYELHVNKAVIKKDVIPVPKPSGTFPWYRYVCPPPSQHYAGDGAGYRGRFETI